MGSHPLNLGLRFVLELTALCGMGIWGHAQTTTNWRWIVALALPLAAAAIWGTFAVPGDPSRSGSAPVAVPGSLRLALELLVFGAGVAGFVLAGWRTTGLAMATLVVIHYASSWDRITWLVQR